MYYADITYNGILIEENYSNKPPSNTFIIKEEVEPTNNVPIRDLVLVDVTGTVGSTAVPVKIVCAEDGCFDWVWSGVNVTGNVENECNFEPEGYEC